MTKPTMRAAVLHGGGDLRIEAVPMPQPQPGELLLRVAAVGVCGTDATEYAAGPQMFPVQRRHRVTGHQGPMIPGHEFAGYVEAVGTDVADFDQGALVVSGAGVSCGSCGWCRRGRTNLCDRYTTVGLDRDGALAEYATVPAGACLDVTELGLNADVCALAQPMSIAVHAMRRGRPEPGDVALVIGTGGIGAFLVYALASSGITVAAADLNADRLSAAAELGAAYTINPAAHGSIPGALSDEGVAPQLVYEATGTAGALHEAFETLSRGSRLVMIGHQSAPGLVALPEFTRDELELIGTNAHQRAVDLPAAVQLLAERAAWSDVAPVALPLEGVSQALVQLAEGTSERIKTLIDPWADTPRVART